MRTLRKLRRDTHAVAAWTRTLFVAVSVAIPVVTSFVGCSGEPAKFDFDSSAKKLLIEQAASMPMRDLDDMNAGKWTNISLRENQTLTMALLSSVVPPEGTPTDFVLGDIEHVGGINPEKIAAAISGKEHASFLKANYIKKVTGHSDEKSADGVIEFEDPGQFKGTVQFNADKENGKWRIVKFKLPNSGLTLELSENGLWKLTENSRGIVK